MQNRAEGFLDWLGMAQPPYWARSRTLGGFCGFLLVLVCTLLFGSALIAAFFIIWRTLGWVPDSTSLRANSQAVGSPNLGSGALIAAALGAPFVIWATILKHHTLRYQKEGHITDRINKAVEQLGAVRVEEEIGRSVTVWFGPSARYKVSPDQLDAYSKQPRRKITQSFMPRDQNDDRALEMVYDIEVWPFERTVIEWEGNLIKLDEGEVEGHTGDWVVFKRTKPNLELRIGAILSLERIAQDSTRYDRGRDHIRIMEVLCAYIRENAGPAELHPDKDPDPNLRLLPRQDIQIALDVIKRRTPEQVLIEENAKFRLDFRRSDLSGSDLRNGHFKGALFEECRLDRANLSGSDLSGAKFSNSVMNYTRMLRTTLTGADMTYSRLLHHDLYSSMAWHHQSLENLAGLSFAGAEIGEGFGLPKGSKTFGSKDTVLPEALAHEYVKLSKLLTGPQNEHASFSTQQIEGLKDNPLSQWSILSLDDFEMANDLISLRHGLGLRGWPYDDK